MRRSKPEDKDEATFQIMLRTLSPSGSTYSGYKRPTFPLKFERFEMVNGQPRLVCDYSVRVEAVTKIPKTELPVYLARPEQEAEPVKISLVVPKVEVTPAEPAAEGQEAADPERLQPVPGTFTQDWGSDIFSESHNDDLLSPFETPIPEDEDLLSPRSDSYTPSGEGLKRTAAKQDTL